MRIRQKYINKPNLYIIIFLLTFTALALLNIDKVNAQNCGGPSQVCCSEKSSDNGTAIYCNSGLGCDVATFTCKSYRPGADPLPEGCGKLGSPCCTSGATRDCKQGLYCYSQISNNATSFICKSSRDQVLDDINSDGDFGNDKDFNGAANCNLQDDPGCISCIGQGGIWTAIGCIDPSPTGILTGLIRIGYGVMGGVALLQLIFVGLMYQSGDEAKIADARSKLFATLGGVALLTFSVLILRIIGINILDVIPVGGI